MKNRFLLKLILFSVLMLFGTFATHGQEYSYNYNSADGLLSVRAFFHGNSGGGEIPDSAWIIKAAPNYSGTACPTSVTVRHYKVKRNESTGRYDTIYYFKTYPVTAMQCDAFSGTKISSFHLPDNIKCYNYISPGVTPSIGTNLYLSNCSNLMNATIPNWVTFVSLVNCPLITGASLPSGCMWDFSYTGVTNIDFLPAGITYMMGFAGCNIPIVNIPETVTTIYTAAFAHCPISSLTIPESVEAIWDTAFVDCGEIKELFWNAKNCYHLGERGLLDHQDAIFKGCSFESVIVGRNVENTGSRIFNGYDPYDGEQQIIPVKKLTWNAINGSYPYFYSKDLEQVIIGNEVQIIPDYFIQDGSKITEVTIPASVTSIRSYAFWNCSGLTEITIPQSVTSIDYGAFQGCSQLRTVHLNAKKINYNFYDTYRHAFNGCENLTQIIIGEEVESISESGSKSYDNEGLFNIEDNANNIKTVTCYAIVPPAITAKCFSQKTYENAVLEVPQESLEAYRNAVGWKEFFKCIAIEDIPGEDDTLKGDADCDGKISISDVTTLIDHLLGGDVSPFNYDNADVDNDGKITISDVTALIDYLLKGTW